MSIPEVDFGAYSLTEKDVTEEHMIRLAKELKEAFMEVGFVFLKNTGITNEEVKRVMDISKTFFLQSDELKRPFSREGFTNSPNHGWVAMKTGRLLDQRRPEDLKESFNITSLHNDIKWPSGAMKGFQEIQTSFFQRCTELSLRVLRVMAHSLGLDPEVFLSAHRFIGTDENLTTLRTLYYPPVDREKVKENQLRCGEHSDYGSITLLFQGSEGLQLRKRSGEYISAPVALESVLIIISDLMQRLTGDQFVSVRHRVLLPPAGDSSSRQSVAFFVIPDNEALITCSDGSNKYPPTTSFAYLVKRLNGLN